MNAHQKRQVIGAIVGVTGLSLVLSQVATFLATTTILGIALALPVGLIDLWAAYMVMKKGTFA